MSSDPIEVLREALARALRAGYRSGHHDTVDGRYTDVMHGDHMEFFADEADELLADPDFAALASLSAPKPESVEAVAWIDRDGDVWKLWRDIPHSKLRDARPLFTAPPRPEASDAAWLLPILDAAAQGQSVSMAAGDAARRIRAGHAPQQASAPDYGDCCDSPAYCSSVRRCTAKDVPPIAPVGVEGRAREAVALALDEAGHHTEANNVRNGIDLDEYREALSIARNALAKQPSAAPVGVEGLADAWEARAAKSHPSDAMLINKHVRELREALAQQPAADTVTVQQAWEWAGGNPGIKATREELEEALRELDAVCDEADQKPAAVDGAMVERAWVAFCENNGPARQGIRAALTAALARSSNVSESGSVQAQPAAVEGDVAWIRLCGSQGEPAGAMTVTAELRDGSEVVLIRDTGNEIDHAVNLAAALAGQQQGGTPE